MLLQIVRLKSRVDAKRAAAKVQRLRIDLTCWTSEEMAKIVLFVSYVFATRTLKVRLIWAGRQVRTLEGVDSPKIWCREDFPASACGVIWRTRDAFFVVRRFVVSLSTLKKYLRDRREAAKLQKVFVS